jgi:hypothetical protein
LGALYRRQRYAGARRYWEHDWHARQIRLLFQSESQILSESSSIINPSTYISTNTLLLSISVSMSIIKEPTTKRTLMIILTNPTNLIWANPKSIKTSPETISQILFHAKFSPTKK